MVETERKNTVSFQNEVDQTTREQLREFVLVKCLMKEFMSNYKLTNIGKNYEIINVVMKEHYFPVMHEFYCALNKGRSRLASEITNWINVHYEMHSTEIKIAIHAEDSETEEDHPRVSTRPYMTEEMLYENLFVICENNITANGGDFTFGKIMRFFSRI